MLLPSCPAPLASEGPSHVWEQAEFGMFEEDEDSDTAAAVFAQAADAAIFVHAAGVNRQDVAGFFVAGWQTIRLRSERLAPARRGGRWGTGAESHGSSRAVDAIRASRGVARPVGRQQRPRLVRQDAPAGAGGRPGAVATEARAGGEPGHALPRAGQTHIEREDPAASKAATCECDSTVRLERHILCESQAEKERS